MGSIIVLAKPGESPFIVNKEELNKCRAKLADRDLDVISLQKKVIQLFDEIREFDL